MPCNFSYRFGGTSGRFSVAEVIALVFCLHCDIFMSLLPQ